MSAYVVGVDAGKTACRVGIRDDRNALAVSVTNGVVTSPDAAGVRRAADAIARAVVAAMADAGRAASECGGIAVGLAGVTTLRGGAAALADDLAGLWPGVDVAIAPDSVTAHAGALGGGAGVVLAAGTGVIALGLAGDGRWWQVDGWGQWLGDDGSGAWIGREALRAVMRAADGRGPETALSDLAEARFAATAKLATVLSFDADLPTRTAAFAPDVMRAAELGDLIAAGVVARATDAWIESTLAAADATGAQIAACVGGLADVDALRTSWEEGIANRLAVAREPGTALDGAVLLAQRTDLPHEARVRRCRRNETSHESEGLDVLATEGVRVGLDDLETRDTGDIVGVLLDAEAQLPSVLAGARSAIADAVDLSHQALRSGGRIVYVGAGTPGRLAALDAAECPPTFGVGPERVIAVLAGGSGASARAVEGAEDRAEDAVEAIADRGVGPTDVVVGISASGRTPFVLAALCAARDAGAATVAVANNAGSVIGANADVAIELLTGAEVISGSTRLTAGTAQKITLNVLSTATMIRLGKTYGPWMVDVVASNHKLRRRAVRIVRDVGGADDATALATLEAADWHTKTAIVSMLAKVDIDEARARLASSDGRVRTAIEVDR